MRGFLVLAILTGCSQLFGLDVPTRIDGDGDGDSGVAQPDTAADSPPVSDMWWDTEWSDRRRVTIDTSALTDTLTDFPVLVRIPGAMLVFSSVRFVADDNVTVLDHDVEDCSLFTECTFWVRVPALAPNVPKSIWLYYGNQSAPSGADPAGVFAAQHVSVHHLETLADVTGHAHTATSLSSATTPAAAAGIVSGGRTFDGTDDYVSLAGEPAYDFTTALYVSLWFRSAGFTTAWQALVAKGDTSWRVQRYNLTTTLTFSVTENAAQINHIGATAVDDGAWHHVAVVAEVGARRLYVDGQLDASVSSAANIETNDLAVAFGQNEEGLNGLRYWNGSIDEVRISSLPRSASWILAEYLTVTSSTFVTLGAEEDVP